MGLPGTPHSGSKCSIGAQGLLRLEPLASLSLLGCSTQQDFLCSGARSTLHHQYCGPRQSGAGMGPGLWRRWALTGLSVSFSGHGASGSLCGPPSLYQQHQPKEGRKSQRILYLPIPVPMRAEPQEPLLTSVPLTKQAWAGLHLFPWSFFTGSHPPPHPKVPQCFLAPSQRGLPLICAYTVCI